MIEVYKEYKYKIVLNEITLWLPEQDTELDEPVLFQPLNPKTGVPFLNEDEAKVWIESYIENKFVNPIVDPYHPTVRLLVLSENWKALAELPNDMTDVLPQNIQDKIAEYRNNQAANEQSVSE